MPSLSKLNPNIFRAYDIRGLVDVDLNSNTAYFLGKGIGTFLKRNGAKSVTVGRDNRLSSEHLKDFLIEGIRSTGCNVVDIGLSTSPLLYASVVMWDQDGGINVTGSHNPIEFNGFKITGRDAYPVATEEIQRIRKIIENTDFEIGKGTLNQCDPKAQYFDKIRSVVQIERPMKIAIDTGNGVAGLVSAPLLKSLGCEVIELFSELDGSFPNHLPDPENEENLEQLKKHAANHGVEAGFGYDGDGDRVGLVDEHGNYRAADYIIILLARDYLTRHPGERILIDVKASMNVVNDIRKHHGEPFMWKTGHSLVKLKMREEKIQLGGELSGHMFLFEDFFPFDDALFATAKLLAYLSKSEKTISEHLANLPALCSTPLILIPCSDDTKFSVVKKATRLFAEKHPVNDVDGARISYDDGWAVVRASNTTPNLTVRFEATNKQALDRIQSEVYNVLERFPSANLDESKTH
jgi:phosphomannomutase/phosphoglucomutase